jgi:hypothetical protein
MEFVNYDGTNWREVNRHNALTTRKDNTSTSNPTVNDDTGDGYTVGSHWYNTTADSVFICVDASSGAAIWECVSTTETSASSTTNTSTTSTSYVVLNSMTITPAAGTYSVRFSASFRPSTKAQEVQFAVHSNATIHADSQRRLHNISGHDHDLFYPSATFAHEVTVNGSQAIDIRWRSLTGDSADCEEREMIIQLLRIE